MSGWHITPPGYSSQLNWLPSQEDQGPLVKMEPLGGQDLLVPQECLDRLEERGGKDCQE